MFGNKISDEERNNSIHTALAAFVPFGVRGVSGKLNVKANGTTNNFVIFNKTHKDSMPKPKGTDLVVDGYNPIMDYNSSGQKKT